LKPSKKQSDAQKNAYEYVGNGLKVHNETGELYVTGMKVKKTVIEKGDNGEDTRRPLTKAKDLIRSKMKSTQYRQYKLGNFGAITLSKETLIIG
jgi:hypothetical protein